MKKLLLTAVVMVFALYSFGQGISGGIKAGLNLANQKISGDGISLDTKAKPGVIAGAYFTAMISEKFGIQPEVLFAMQGSKFDIPGVDGQFNFSYINIPILARYNINEMISIHAGPQFGMLLSAEQEFDGDTQDVKDDMKGMDIGGGVGAEADLPNGLGFGARYVFGLSNVSDEDDPDGDFELKNNAIQIYLKYTIFGKKK